MSDPSQLRAQEQRSLSFWERVAHGDHAANLHGVLDADPLLSSFRDAAEKRVLFDRLGDRLKPTDTVLEVGCGGGRWTPELAQRAACVVATDLSPTLVERARERVSAAAIANVELRAGSFETLQYSRTFDLVYLGSCLHYMSEDAIVDAMANLAPATTAQCVLLSRDTVSLTGTTFRRQERYGGDDPAIYRPIEVYEAIMAKHGWRLIDWWPTYVKPWLWGARKVIPNSLLRPLMHAGLPAQPFRVNLSKRWGRAGAKQHRFFRYERTLSPRRTPSP